MKFSMKSRYGIRALIDLAASSKTEQIPLNLLAERNAISPQYLEQVFANLRRAGIVKSVKGPQGGYYLGRSADTITAAEIIHAIDGDYFLADEKVPSACENGEISKVVQELVVDGINRQVDKVLKGVTLGDLEGEYKRRKEKTQFMYYI